MARADLYARLLDGFDHLLDQKFKESVQIWPDDEPIPMGDGTYIMPTEIEIVSVPEHHGIVGMLWGAKRQEEPMRVINVQESLNRLQHCPVCGGELFFYPDDNQTRNCTCGSFKMTEVHSDGDIIFEFHLLAEENGPRP
jgi:hypothetical protein